jgi:protein-tyrosine sulfotransferase
LELYQNTFSGEETRVIPRILALRAQWKKSEKEWRRLQEAGVDDRVINAAITAFIVQVSTIFHTNSKHFQSRKMQYD